MAKEREKFVAGCDQANKISRAKADQIFDLLEKFAGYGFNKSHSAAYAVLAMQTGWLKAHHPAEYMAALMCNDIGKTDALAKFCAECRTMGVTILPPDVNRSDVKFTVEDGAVRYGLAGVKGVGEAAVELLVAERAKGGAFGDLDDLCHRVDPTLLGRKTLESLAKVGAFDGIDPNRRRVFESVGPAMEGAAEFHRDAKKGQASLFGDVNVLREPSAKGKRAAKDEPDWTLSERINHERDLLGVYLSAHPLDGHQDVLSQLQVLSLSEAETSEGRQVVRVAALLTGLELRYTKDKRPFARAVLEDRTGSIPLFVSPSDYEKFGPVLKERQVCLVAGYVEDDRRGGGGGEGAEERQASFRALEIVPVEQASARFAESVTVELRAGGTEVDPLDQLLRRHSGGVPIRFQMPWRGGVVQIEPNAHFFVRPGGEFLRELGDLPGVARVSVRVTRQPPLPEREERKERGGRNGF
jgi:DNA polymerase-3 subunit alpha